MKPKVTVLLLVTYICGPINANDGIPEGRIVYGNDVHDCLKYPWHAQLSYSAYMCGGSLISDKYVLTAAHCSDDCIVGSKYTVRLGSTKKVSGKKYLGRLKACHNSYQVRSEGFTYYDIAIVELTESVEMTPCIDPISIIRTPIKIRDDLLVTAIGFGTTDNDEYPSTLQEATELRIMNQHLCEEEIDVEYGSLSTHICTKSKVVKDQSACMGDSGGSMFHKKEGNETVLLGVTSSVTVKNGICERGVTAYTRMNHPKVISWIKQITK